MSLEIKTVAITGATGGLGKILANDLASLGINLIFIDRNIQKSKKLADEILSKYSNIKIDFVTTDLLDFDSVKKAASVLKDMPLDALVLNAGIYSVPVKKNQTGYNNIFQVNFISQYYIVRELISVGKPKKVVAVGSIAQNLSKINLNDVDYSNKKNNMKIYGNSKKFLMFSLASLLKDNQNTKFSIAHPGITSTNMTNHFHKSINWFVKFGMKLVFSSPKKAVQNIEKAVFDDCGYLEWIGPSIFNVWGKPKISKIKNVSAQDVENIDKIANKIYDALKA